MAEKNYFLILSRNFGVNLWLHVWNYKIAAQRSVHLRAKMASRLDTTNKDVRVLQDGGGKPNTRKSTPKTFHYNLPTYTPPPPPPPPPSPPPPPPPPCIGPSTILHSAMCEPLLKLFKMHFAFFIGTSKPLCNLHSVLCVRNRFVAMHQ